MAHRLAPEAAAEVDRMWDYIAQGSGSIDRADRVVDGITERFICFPPILALAANDPACGRDYVASDPATT